MRVGIRSTDKGWGNAIYSKNNILIAKLNYLFLPIIRVIKLPITISRFFIRTFIKDKKKVIFKILLIMFNQRAYKLKN